MLKISENNWKNYETNLEEGQIYTNNVKEVEELRNEMDDR